MPTVALVAALSFILNLPFGYLRKRSKRYSLQWFLYVHLPVPLVVAARLISHTDYRYIPFFIAAAALGQFCGGRLGSGPRCGAL